jgi:flagellar biosynthesis/type III secretory pathway protein FliH
MVTNDPPSGTDGPAPNWYRWIFGQPAYIVLLASLMAAVGYGTWYGLPAALHDIQRGYEELNTQHQGERKELREETKQAREEAKQDRVEFRDALTKSREELRTAIEKNTSTIEKNTGTLEKLDERLQSSNK